MRPILALADGGRMSVVSLEDRVEELGGVGAVAKKTKLSRATFYKAFDRERDEGSHNMDTSSLEKIAEAFDRSVEWVRSGSDGEEKAPPNTLENARLVAKLVVKEYALDERDAWLILYDLQADAGNVPELFEATSAKLRAMGVPRRNPPSKPAGDRRARSER